MSTCVYMHVHMCVPRQADWRPDRGVAVSREKPDEAPGLVAERDKGGPGKGALIPPL